MLRQALTNLTTNRHKAVGAATATSVHYSDVLDLGVKHNYDRLCAVKRGLASANETLLIEQSHNGDADSPAWELAPMLVTGGMQSASYRQNAEVCVSPPSAADMVIWAAPCARWIRVKYTNGDTAQTALALELTAFPS